MMRVPTHDFGLARPRSRHGVRDRHAHNRANVAPMGTTGRRFTEMFPASRITSSDITPAGPNPRRALATESWRISMAGALMMVLRSPITAVLGQWDRNRDGRSTYWSPAILRLTRAMMSGSASRAPLRTSQAGIRPPGLTATWYTTRDRESPSDSTTHEPRNNGIRTAPDRPGARSPTSDHEQPCGSRRTSITTSRAATTTNRDE